MIVIITAIIVLFVVLTVLVINGSFIFTTAIATA